MTNAKKILIFGLPGSGKSTLANKIAQKLGCQHLNADNIREKFNDWDFSEDGRRRQAFRMSELSNINDKQYVVIDFVCPKQEYREIIDADINIFMDTIKEGRFNDTNKLFEVPSNNENISFIFDSFNSDEHAQLVVSDLISFDWRKPTVQMLGRWQPFHDGHVELFKRSIAKTGQVNIQVRDCRDWNDSNPFPFDFVKSKIISKLNEVGFVEGKDYIITLVPNVTNITYGRDVGYVIEQEVFDDKIHEISATKIRKQMGFDK